MSGMQIFIKIEMLEKCIRKNLINHITITQVSRITLLKIFKVINKIFAFLC